MSGFIVSVARDVSGALSENGGTMLSTLSVESETTCGTQSGTINPGDRIRIRCQPFPAVGRYVIVSLTNDRRMTLCEVKVVGNQDVHGKRGEITLYVVFCFVEYRCILLFLRPLANDRM